MKKKTKNEHLYKCYKLKDEIKSKQNIFIPLAVAVYNYGEYIEGGEFYYYIIAISTSINIDGTQQVVVNKEVRRDYNFEAMINALYKECSFDDFIALYSQAMKAMGLALDGMAEQLERNSTIRKNTP